jgi:hypothetical protein
VTLPEAGVGDRKSKVRAWTSERQAPKSGS